MYENRSDLNRFLGGGTFDIAIVTISPLGMYHVRSTNGNTRLGGAKFVDLLMKHFVDKLLDKLEGMPDLVPVNMDLFNNKELSVIRAACEKAKKELSTKTETEIIVSDQRYEIH